MDEDSRTQLEAAAFRGLVAHLQQRTDVQNIDLMNLAGFCRNCLSKWYMAAAQDQGVPVDYDAARELVYGMAYNEWKRDYQRDATVPASYTQLTLPTTPYVEHSVVAGTLQKTHVLLTIHLCVRCLHHYRIAAVLS